MIEDICLLKEQRARMLTIEEIQPNELVYIEVPQSDEICPAFLVESDWFEHRTWRTTGYGATHYFLHDGYGRDWRCWSANPTDEQRQTVKWE